MIARMFGIGRNHQFGGLQQELKEFQCKFPAGYRVPDLMDDTTDGSMTMTSEAKQSCLALEHPEIFSRGWRVGIFTAMHGWIRI